jgi:MFS family permease
MLPTITARWALAGLSLPVLLASLGTSSANVGLPVMGEAFGASFPQLQWIVLAYLLGSTTLVVGAGRLADLAGRRRLLLSGIALFTTASVLCGAAPTLPLLIAARALQGLGAAVMMTIPIALIGEVVPKARTGSATGLLGTTSAVGTALGPTLGGALITGFGWPAIFLLNLPLGLLALGLAYRCLPADRPWRTADLAGFDTPGTLLLALTLGAYALAMTAGHGGFGTMNAVLLSVTLLGVGLFVRVQARASSPLLRLAMFRDPVLSAGLAMAMLVATVMMATMVVGPFYLSRALGLQPAVVGLAMSVGPLVAALVGVPAGRLVDRLGAGRLTTIGLGGMAAGAILLSLASVRFGIAAYVAPLVIVTAGYALFQAANNTAIMVDVPPEARGVVSGMLNLSRNLGLITGASAMGAAFVLASAASDSTPDGPDATAAGLRVTFALAAMLVVLALVIAAAARRMASRSPAAALLVSAVVVRSLVQIPPSL